MSLSVRSIKAVAPLFDRILVQRIKPVEKTASGLYLPSSQTDKQTSEATVLATGPGASNEDGKIRPLSVASGDKVLLPQYGGTEVKVGEDTYHLFRESEILAKLQE